MTDVRVELPCQAIMCSGKVPVGLEEVGHYVRCICMRRYRVEYNEWTGEFLLQKEDAGHRLKPRPTE